MGFSWDKLSSDARARQDFFTRMSREMWFEYTVQPSSLQLSLGAMQQTGLPAVMVGIVPR